ncbi:MAG: 4Fe-4S dicluster domain-containing protein [Deltaproteobacteria bacterium]|nr:4Fe-4S dicluster domain-containing protein [Deltaproteobacteria bacterium]
MKNIEYFRFISDSNFKKLVTRLIHERKVYGTIKKDGHPAFANITDVSELELFQTPTHLSAKQFLFPQRETLLKFDIRHSLHQAVIEAESQVIIGLHPCDIHAINLMDEVWAYGKPDPNYLTRRDNTILIGTDCFPDSFCFCKSMGTMDVNDGFDIFLHRIKKGFLARVATNRGEEILSGLNLREAKGAEVRELEKLKLEKEGAFTASIDAEPKDLPGIYGNSDNSPVWDKIGAICTGCGSCNNVCPTCYCFDIKDEVKPNLSEGERVRLWDGCTLEDFAKVAGGHNFRKSRAERLRHRFNRKFRYLTDKFGTLFCVGCGRCSRACLVKINITEVTNELIRESNKRQS